MMIEYLYNLLQPLKNCFRNKKTYSLFVIAVIGLILATDRLGVSSIVRALSLIHSSYDALLGFFSSTAFTLSDVAQTWITLISSQAPFYEINGRPVLIGDHKKVPKEAKKMPGVKRHKQESENVGKAEYILGHCFGCIGVLVGSASRYMCLPLSMNLHDGLKFLTAWYGKKTKSMVEHIIEDGRNVTKSLNRDTYLVLDAYFLTKAGLERLEELNSESDQRIDMVTRAKCNCKAYFPLTQEEKDAQIGKVGRHKKKGNGVKVSQLFDERRDEFETASVLMYGEKKAIRYLPIVLHWGEGLYYLLQFVLVEVDGNQLILVCTDLDVDAKTVIHLYSCRFSIEESFRWMNTEVATFSYRFWSKAMKKLNRYYKSSDPDSLASITNEAERADILKTIERIHRYVYISCIALGVLELLCIKFQGQIDKKDICFMRTFRGGDMLTVGQMKRFLQVNFSTFLAEEPFGELRQIIRERQSKIIRLFCPSKVA